jgi:ADP-ribosylglycohydrolase
MQFPHPSKHVLPDKIPLPSSDISQNKDVHRFSGCLVGLAVGDALGASVEFRPRHYFIEHPVVDMEGGGTWGLKPGQWTDDTSMALCLASSLITRRGYDPYDQMVRYKWWYKDGYMSSTGSCFDIGNATRDSLDEFIHRQKSLRKYFPGKEDKLDSLSMDEIKSVTDFNVNCSSDGVAGNGALMRLAPVPLFFYRYPEIAVEYAGCSARLTHGDKKAVDACRYYAALIVAAVRGEPKESILSKRFYEDHPQWFGSVKLHAEILRVAQGSYRNSKGYDGGIRGKGYIVNALEAALWAFWSDENSFEKGALAAVNLGDDTDTTAAIYGQLAGAFYGCDRIPNHWRKKLYAYKLLECIGQCLYSEGTRYNPTEKERKMISSRQNSTTQQSNYNLTPTYNEGVTSNIDPAESKYTSKSRSDNHELSLSQREYNRSRMYPQGNDQASSYRSNVDQGSEHRQNTNRPQMRHEDVHQTSTYSVDNNRSSYMHHPDTEQLSTPRVNDKRVSAHGSVYGRSSIYSTDHMEPSSYTTYIHPSSTDNPRLKQLQSQNSTKVTNADRHITNPYSIHGIGQTSHNRDDNRYGYGPTQIEVRSSSNNDASTYGVNSRRRIDESSYNALRYTNSINNYGNSTAGASDYTGYGQLPFDYLRRNNLNSTSQTYYIRDGKTDRY